MKLLDIHALSLTSSFPTYAFETRPPPSIFAMILLTELRYESFRPNPIRLPNPPTQPLSSSAEKRQLFYGEPAQFLIHILLFLFLQLLPQWLPIKALGILLTIWIIWTGLQLAVRYPTSPPLFGPIYLADSLAGFWTETWHNAFASPCYSLAYTPTFYILSKLGVPRDWARSAGVFSSFALMAVFHMYALSPLLDDEGRRRIGWFFVLNGAFTVLEVAIWKKKKHWVRAVVAWIIELAVASWTVLVVDVADGVLDADWRALCRARGTT